MNKKINVQNVDKLNKKFANVMTKLQSYAGTDPESVVQAAYNKYFTAYFGLEDTDIVRVEKCDSYFIKDNLTLLIEYKFDVDFSDPLVRSKVLAQTVFYYKRIIENEKKGNAIPNAVFIGDVNECFCLKTSLLSKHLNIDGVDYSVAPSSAGSQMALVNALMNDEDIKKSVFVINPQKDNMSYICEKLISISQNKEAQIPISKKNIHRVFETFVSKVVNDKKYDTNEIVGLFIDAIKHPDKRIIAGDMMVVHPYKPVKVFTNKAIALFNFFSKPSDEDAKSLAMIYDTLVKDSDRRAQGFFNTKSIWVDLAHKYISNFLKSVNFSDADNWEYSDNIICWDPAAGTKSLTKEYRFKNLYVSTLNNAELNASVEFNPEAKETFIYDFLNDPISKLPVSLAGELFNLRNNQSKKLCFLMNPPYGHADAIKSGNMQHRSLSVVAADMKNFGMKGAGEEMFVQFLFKINQICDHFKIRHDQVIIATFSKPTFMCKESFEDFRKFWLSNWKYEIGFIFNASEFDGCSDQWPVSFSVWHNVKSIDKKLFKHEIYESTDEADVKLIGTKTLYNIDGEQLAKNWIYDKKLKNSVEVPTTANGYILESNTLKMVDGFLGFYGGTLHKNILTVPFKYGHGFSILPYNIDRVVAYFAATNVVDHKWQNDKDIYMVPDETNAVWKEFVKDSLVYSLFASNICSIKDAKYVFVNNFYPFSKSKTYGLLGIQFMKNEVDEKRWCLANGKFDNLSNESIATLDAFAECIRKSASYRGEYSKLHPEYSLNCWDCGWQQSREFFKETCSDEVKILRSKIKALKEKLNANVYNLGFLNK